MKLVNVIVAAVLFFGVFELKAQKYELGKVSIAELEQKVHPLDSTAAAAVLYKKGEVRIEYDQNEGFVAITDVETRIKIYKKEAYDLANQKVWFYSAVNLSEKVIFSDAVTYNLVNGKIEKTKLKSEGIFTEVLNKYNSQKKITMPNVKEGSVIEFKYSIKTPNPSIIRDWDFQSGIPVNYSEFVTYIPEYYVFNSRQKGFVYPKITVKKNNKSIIFTNKERSGGSVSSTTFSTNQVDYFETQTTYIAENFPAIKDEEFVNNIRNYTASVEFELSVINWPNQPMKVMSADWNSVVKTIYEYNSFGPELNKTGYFEEDLKALLARTNTPEEKVMAILQYVKSRVKWNGVAGYECENGVKKAYKEKSGNIGDINLMLTAMLRYAGLTANPVLVSTRDNGIAMFPNRTAFNYVIAAVETPNGHYLVDASARFSTPNILPFRTLNWFGRLIRKDGSSEQISLMPKKTSNTSVFLSYDINPDGTVAGKAKKQSTDYAALTIRDKISGQKQEDYLEKFENQNRKIEVSEYVRENEKEILKPLTESYSFNGNNLCEVIGGKIYFNPMLFFSSEKNPFKQEIREYPVDFGFPFADKYTIVIKVPDGFAVETLPAPITINMEDNLGSFKFNIAETGNSLQLVVSHQINQGIVSIEKYEMLKEYYKKMIAKETEKIVLKRI